LLAHPTTELYLPEVTESVNNGRQYRQENVHGACGWALSPLSRAARDQNAAHSPVFAIAAASLLAP